MKKFIVAILALLYITTSTGATIYMHYCMGELADWGIGHIDSKTCGKCGMEKANEKDNGCCKDEQKFVKGHTDQKTVEAGFLLIQLTSVALPLSYIEFPLPNFSCVTKQNAISHAPPRSAGVAVYIRNCVFLI